MHLVNTLLLIAGLACFVASALLTATKPVLAARLVAAGLACWIAVPTIAALRSY